MFVSALTQLVFYLSIQHERNSISMCLEWIFSKIGWFSMVQNRFFKHQKLLNFGHVLWLIKKSVRQKLFINIVSLMSHSLTAEIWFVSHKANALTSSIRFRPYPSMNYGGERKRSFLLFIVTLLFVSCLPSDTLL